MTTTDPNFAGSIFEVLGFDAELCDYCDAHLFEGVCLNACHLRVGEWRVMQTGLAAAKARLDSKQDDEPAP